MPFLPRDHVTLPVVATYLAAAILHDNHSSEIESRAPAPFDVCRLIVDRHSTVRAPNDLAQVTPLPPPRVKRYDLVSETLRVHLGPGSNAYDPTGFEVSVVFAERNGQTLYAVQSGSSSSEVKKLELTLAPPVVGCLSRTRLRAGLNARGLLEMSAPLPDSIQVRTLPFEEQLVTRYRQILAEGDLGAVLVDGRGRSVSIPASHWREDSASAAFVEPHPVLMTLDGQDVRGFICVNLRKLSAGWRDAFNALPVSPELAEAEFPAGSAQVGTAPLLDFALYLARKLRIVDGRGMDGLPIAQGTLERLIQEQWLIYGKLGVDPSPNRLKILATVLRRLDEKPGPKEEYSTLK